MVACVRELGLSLADVLPHFTSNTARALKLRQKGQLKLEMDADVLVLREETLEIVHLWARGRHMIRDGQIIVKGLFE